MYQRCKQLCDGCQDLIAARARDEKAIVCSFESVQNRYLRPSHQVLEARLATVVCQQLLSVMHKREDTYEGEACSRDLDDLGVRLVVIFIVIILTELLTLARRLLLR